MAGKIQHQGLLDFILQQTKPGDKVLDIGCGNKWYWPAMLQNKRSIIGIDAWGKFQPHLIVDLEKETIPWPSKLFDVVFCLDLIEHLSKPAGERLLLEIDRLCCGKALMLTPLKWDDNEKPFHDEKGDYFQNPWVVHRTLWKPEEFTGYVDHPRVVVGSFMGVKKYK